jgi:hypothetical protein
MKGLKSTFLKAVSNARIIKLPQNSKTILEMNEDVSVSHLINDAIVKAYG